MDQSQSSDDECLDLEALEALLDEDDKNDDLLSVSTKSFHEDGAPKADAKSVEDFLNATSDSDEDEKRPKQSLSSMDQRRAPSSCSEETNFRDLKVIPPKGMQASERKKNEGENSVDKSPNKQIPAQSDPTTKALQEEMAKMQQKMLELQKLLETRSPNLSSKSKQTSENSEKHKIAHESNKTKSVDVSNRVLKPNTCSKKIFQEQLVKQPSKKENENVDNQRKLKLIDETGDSPFFDRPPVSSLSKKDKEGNDIKHNKKGQDKKRMERALFGDSDSDWEDMDGEDKRILSDEGLELKRIMNSREKARVAHKPKFGTTDLGRGATQSWARYYSETEADKNKSKKKEHEKKVKNLLHCKSSSSDQTNSNCAVAEEEQSVTEAYSNIRIVNPLISSSLMKMRMEGRKMIGIPRIHLKMKTQDVQGDWVTIGVVVGKSDPKTSSSGKPYSIWKLNDLEDLDNSVSFFLFGEVHKQLWKTDLGTVIGVLNPSIMDAMEKNAGEPAFTIKNPSQMMVMGRSKDLSWCTSRTKGGNKCCKFINKRLGEFCAYHVQAAYRKTSAARLELHGSITGIRPKSFEKKIFAKDCAYTYGGQTFVPNSRLDSGKTKKGVTLSKLQRSMTEGRYQKVNTLSIHNVKPQHSPLTKASGKIQEDSNDTFLDMISVPSAGSMNFVAHLKNQEGAPGSGSGTSLNVPGASGPVQSISAKELMKKHEQEMKQKRLAHKRCRSGVETHDPLQLRPQLGKGLSQNQEIVLDVGNRAAGKADVAKLKAIAAVKQMGGLEKLDPNAVKSVGKKIQEKVKKRVEDDCGGSPSLSPEAAVLKQEQNLSARSPKLSEPPKKKSKLLGDVDLNSDEVKTILKARSKHKGVLAQAEAEREDAYFTELEKKEKLEEKMLSVTSIEITVVTCKQCMYTAQSAKDTCKKEGHPLKRSKAKKRFFICKKCKHRTYVIDAKFPTESCRKCGEMSYEKTSMCPVRTGPKLDSEVLIHRGDEVKYLNSLDQKVYLNTVIDK